MEKIRLRKKLDRRFVKGHPWVFSNELVAVPKFEPGSLVELQTESGDRLAIGYYNPHSLISFRLLARGGDATMATTSDFLPGRLATALAMRKRLGLLAASARIAFGEADGLPGLVVDAFAHASDDRMVWVFQPATAGADKLIAELSTQRPVLDELCRKYFGRTLAWTIVKNNSQSRLREGLALAPPTITGDVTELADFPVAMPAPGGTLTLHADLAEGQKTGFFLDQRDNIQLLVRKLTELKPEGAFRSLDICTYVGQWSAQIGATLAAAGATPELNLFDSSDRALRFANRNVAAAVPSAKVEARRGDALEDLKDYEPASFDLVICDPPALVKSRTALEAGGRAYTKLNAEAMRLVRPGGLFVSCSCSGLLTDDMFLESLGEAARRARRRVSIFARGGQAADHPIDPAFPEGRYLKAHFAVVND